MPVSDCHGKCKNSLPYLVVLFLAETTAALTDDSLELSPEVLIAEQLVVESHGPIPTDALELGRHRLLLFHAPLVEVRRVGRVPPLGEGHPKKSSEYSTFI